MKIYIVRHGQVSHNALKQYNTTDEDLTEIGVEQALQLKEKIKDIKFDVLMAYKMVNS